MRTFGLACLLFGVLLITDCGDVFFRGEINTNGQTASGVVSVVQFTIVVDNGISTQVTVVTLQNNFSAATFSFCGDQRGQFPLSSFAEATFIFGQPCSNLLNVVIRIN